MNVHAGRQSHKVSRYEAKRRRFESNETCYQLFQVAGRQLRRHLGRHVRFETVRCHSDIAVDSCAMASVRINFGNPAGAEFPDWFFDQPSAVLYHNKRQLAINNRSQTLRLSEYG